METSTRKHRNEKLSDQEISRLRGWYRHYIPAKVAAETLNVSYQCVYVYYKGFESAGLPKLTLDEITAINQEMNGA